MNYHDYITSIAEIELRRVSTTISDRVAIEVSDEPDVEDPTSMGITDTLLFGHQPHYTVTLFPTQIMFFADNAESEFTDELLDTIRHEFAHVAHIEEVASLVGTRRTAAALTGVNCFHGRAWKRWARALGARPVAWQSASKVRAAKKG